MNVEDGDHFWFWNGNISRALDIPRTEWFPESTGPTDYLGNGKEIYNYVVLPEGVARGRPQMRGLEGSYAWLDNNPGNITGRAGGATFGAYPGKFNWHHFLIFPTWDDGMDAIRQLLLTPSYVHLSILDAFRRYAPESDGNDPVHYAQTVAAAAGVDITTVIGDLDDNTMIEMQNAIATMEGAFNAGDIFSRDFSDLPADFRAALES